MLTTTDDNEYPSTLRMFSKKKTMLIMIISRAEAKLKTSLYPPFRKSTLKNPP